jgi:hypothetical protein
MVLVEGKVNLFLAANRSDMVVQWIDLSEVDLALFFKFPQLVK